MQDNEYLVMNSGRMSAGKLWWAYVKKRKILYFLGLLMIMTTNLFQVVTPRFMGWALDFLKGDEIPHFLQASAGHNTFSKIIFYLLVSATILFLARVGWRIFLARNTHHASAWLKKNIWQHVRFFPKEKLQKEYSLGNLMNISTSDIQAARYLFGFTLVAYCDVIFLGIFTFVAMCSVNLSMTFWALLFIPILPVFITRLAEQEADRHEEAQEFLSKFNEQCAQAIATIKLQRVTQTGKFWERKLIRSADEYRGKRLRTLHTSYKFYPIMGVSSIISYIVLFIFGLSKAITGSMTIGDFVVMQSYIFLIQEPLLELGFVISEWQRGRASLDRVANILNEPKDRTLVTDAHVALSETESDIVLKTERLSFKFADSERELIKDFSFELKKGERLGIIGTIGSGKTTLVNILSGLERAYKGNLYFLGRPIAQYAHIDLRRYIGLVPQRPFIFADTVRNNISLDKNISDEEVWDLLKIVGLDEEVKLLPHQLETGLGEWGVNLSGGQKQRLTLARALAHRPKLLFLDDCLSAVDTITEEKILNNLHQHLSGPTLVWVAHRKSTLKYCDRIIDLAPLEIETA